MPTNAGWSGACSANFSARATYPRESSRRPGKSFRKIRSRCAYWNGSIHSINLSIVQVYEQKSAKLKQDIKEAKAAAVKAAKEAAS
jgi:hypothetical protein